MNTNNDQKTICMTGKGNSSRSEMIQIIEKMGYIYNDQLTKDTSILLYEDISCSSKIAKAQKYGIDMIQYNDFF